MSMEPIAISTSATSELSPGAVDSQAWPLLPVETEIYILPDGRVVVADLPAELVPLLAALGIADGMPMLANTLTPLPAAEPLEVTTDDE